MFEEHLEDIAQETGVIDYGDAYTLNDKAEQDKEFRKKIRLLIGDWEDAIMEGDMEEAKKIARQLKELSNQLKATKGDA